MISTLLDWVARPGIGAVTVAVTVWAARRLRGSERLRTILSRVIGAAIHEAVTQVVLPPVADRLSSIETTLGVFAEAQTRIDATITAHMDAEERARADDIAWRKRRQSEHDTRLAAIEARLALLEVS